MEKKTLNKDKKENFMKRVLSVILIVLLCAAALTGCKKQEPVTLNVFAAASLTEALNEIAALYKVKNPSVTISFNYDSSGKLQTQIENGAEADLYVKQAELLGITKERRTQSGKNRGQRCLYL